MPVSVHIAVLAVAKDGAPTQTVTEMVTGAGHRVVSRATVMDSQAAIRAQLARWIDDKNIDVVIVSGGTESTSCSGAMKPLITQTLPGFTDLFRYLAFQEIGASAMLSNAEAAQCNETYVFVLPAAAGTVRAAMEKLILPQLDSTTAKNLVQTMPRVKNLAEAVPQVIAKEKTAGGQGLTPKTPAAGTREHQPRTGANVLSRRRPTEDPPTRPIDMAKLEQQLAISEAGSSPTKRVDLSKLPKLPPGAEDSYDDEILQTDPRKNGGRSSRLDSEPAPPPAPSSRPFGIAKGDVPAKRRSPTEPPPTPRRTQPSPLVQSTKPRSAWTRTEPSPVVAPARGPAPASRPTKKPTDPPPVPPRRDSAASTPPAITKAPPAPAAPRASQPSVSSAPASRAAESARVRPPTDPPPVPAKRTPTVPPVVAAPAAPPTVEVAEDDEAWPDPAQVAAEDEAWPDPAQVAPEEEEEAWPDPAQIVRLPPAPSKPPPAASPPQSFAALVAPSLATGELPGGDFNAFNYPIKKSRSKLVWLLALLTAGGLGFAAVVYLVPRATSSQGAEPAPPESPPVAAATIDAAAAPEPEPTPMGEIDPEAPLTGDAMTPAPAKPDKSGTKPTPATRPATIPATKPPATKPAPRGSGEGSQVAATPPDGEQPEDDPPIAPPITSSDCDEVACVLAKYDRPCCEKFRPAESDMKPRAGGIPTELDKIAVRSGIEKVKPRVVACGEDHTAKGTVKIAVVVRPDGTVSQSGVALAPDEELGQCVASALRNAQFAKTVKGGSFTYPFVF